MAGERLCFWNILIRLSFDFSKLKCFELYQQQNYTVYRLVLALGYLLKIQILEYSHSKQNRTPLPNKIREQSPKKCFIKYPRWVQSAARVLDQLIYSFVGTSPRPPMGMLLCSIHRLLERSGVSREAETCVWVCRPTDEHLSWHCQRLNTGQGPESSTLSLNLFLSWGSKVNLPIPITWRVLLCAQTFFLLSVWIIDWLKFSAMKL